VADPGVEIDDPLVQPPVRASHCNGKLFLGIPEHAISQPEPRPGPLPALFTLSGGGSGNGHKLGFTKNRQKVTILEWHGAAAASIAMSRMRVPSRLERAAKRVRARPEAPRKLRAHTGLQKEMSGGAIRTARSDRFGWR
jgi:hypothetical protein